MIDFVCVLSLSHYRILEWVVFKNLYRRLAVCELLASLHHSVQLSDFILKDYDDLIILVLPQLSRAWEYDYNGQYKHNKRLQFLENRHCQISVLKLANSEWRSI
jgi:hypothetical protein